MCRALPQHAESLIHYINTLMQTRSRQTGTLAYHSNGLYVPSGHDEAVHLRLRLGREPVPQSVCHTRIQPHGPHASLDADTPANACGPSAL